MLSSSWMALTIAWATSAIWKMKYVKKHTITKQTIQGSTELASGFCQIRKDIDKKTFKTRNRMVDKQVWHIHSEAVTLLTFKTVFCQKYSWVLDQSSSYIDRNFSCLQSTINQRNTKWKFSEIWIKKLIRKTVCFHEKDYLRLLYF